MKVTDDSPMREAVRKYIEKKVDLIEKKIDISHDLQKEFHK